MSRCEHGEPIKLFCVSDTCNWRDAGGCENCLKKYHTHVQNIDTMTLEKLQQLSRMFTVDMQAKKKSRVLQEAVYNYFTLMKSQLSNSIDNVSKVIINKLSFPYLYSEGHLNIFRKIRNKEYKKITKKQLKHFREFANTQNKELIQLNETKLYLQQVHQLSSSIKRIHQSFVSYSKAIQKIDKTFNIEKTFLHKITEMCEFIRVQQKKMNNQKQPKASNIEAGRDPNMKQKVDDKIRNMNNSKPGRDRKISIDNAMGLDLNRFANPAHQNFDDNEKQISERKKKLFQMLNNPTKMSSDTKNVDKIQQGNQQSNDRSQKKDSTSQAKSLEKQIKKIEVRKLFKLNTYSNQTEPQEGKSDKIPEVKASLQQQQESGIGSGGQKKNIFEDLMNMGINLPEIIMHTILPREASKQKLYQDTKDVKERKITIPVKKFEQKQQNQSPLMKVKRKKKKEESEKQNCAQTGQMNKISIFPKEQDNSILEASEQAENHISPVKGKQPTDESLVLKDRQADSLALLLQSLRLPAEKAIPLLETAIKFAYNNLSAAEYLSYLYLVIEKPRQCLDLCNKILQQLEDSPQAMQLSIHISNNKAAALNMLGRYSQSIGILERCLVYSKKDIYYKNLGDSYFSIAIYEKACINYQNAIKLNPHLEEAYYNLAVCYFLQDHLHQAKLNVLNALKINPKNQQYARLNQEIAVKLEA